MDPMSMIGAGTSLVGGIMGAQAANRAQDMNWDINMMNFMLANQERGDQIEAQYKAADERKKERQQQEMGTTDPQANHTYFDPQRGWVTDLSYQGQHRQDLANQLNDLQTQEKMQELSQDIPLQRAQMKRTFDQNYDYANQADAFQRMLHDAIVSGPSKYTHASDYGSKSQAINDAYNAQLEQASRQAVRQGTTDLGPALAQLARARSQDLMGAAQGGYQQDRQAAMGEYNSKIGNLANLYNAFVQGSRGNLGAPGFNASPAEYMPASPAMTQPQVQADAQLMMNDGMQQLAQAYGKQGGRVDYIQPNYGDADAVAGFGKALSGLGKGMGGGASSGSSPFGATTSGGLPQVGSSSGGGDMLGGLFGGGGLGSLTSAFMPNVGVF